MVLKTTRVEGDAVLVADGHRSASDMTSNGKLPVMSVTPHLAD